VVLTGGAASTEGVTDLAEQVFNQPVRKGMPIGISGLVDVVKNPAYSTAVGLVRYGTKHAVDTQFKRGGDNVFNKLVSRMTNWIHEFF